MKTATLLGTLLCTCALLPGQPTVLAPGYGINLFHQAPALTFPTSLTVDDQGRVYCVGRFGVVSVLQDTTASGVANTVTTYWPGNGMPGYPVVGILWFQGRIYLSQAGRITQLEDLDGDLVADVWTDLVTGLPVGWHHNNDLFTDGTYIYFGLGSLTDHDVDPDPRSGTLMRMNPDGTGLTIHATGLRNVFDGAVHPVSGDIWVGDNGPNQVVGNPDPPDELNRIQAGLDYGHPVNWGTPPPGAGTEPPVLDIVSHASPCGMAFSPNSAISGHRNELFMATFNNLLGGNLVRIPVYPGPQSGVPGAWIEPFAAGFQTAIDLEFDQAGTLYVAEYSTDSVWRIVPDGPAYTTIESPPSIGTTCSLTFTAPGMGGRICWAAASTGLGPPIPVGNGLAVDLDVTSWIWLFSITPGNGWFALPAGGVIDPQGQTTGSVGIINDPAAIGVSLEIQYLVINSFGFPLAMSAPTRIVVQDNW